MADVLRAFPFLLSRLRVDLLLSLLLLAPGPALGQARVLDARTHYLRTGASAEWSDTAPVPHARELSLSFAADPAAGEQTLSVRQAGVKQRWRLSVNGHQMGILVQDENPMTISWPVPAGTLVDGENRLRVEPLDSVADDVAIGPVYLRPRPVAEVFREARIDLGVLDENDAPLPARFTITDSSGALQEVRSTADSALAIRPGFVYAADGRASLTLPAGLYRLFAGRGFEYGVDSAWVRLAPGDRQRLTLRITREVPTEGWVSADTHVHTLTHSGHGDATIEERALTLAGEGIELPILTEHNRQIDLGPVAEAMGVGAFFTPVVGDELTTSAGHFNLFPLDPAASPPPADAEDWQEAAEAIARTGAGGVILNHGRDVHSGFRPLDPARHVAVAGMRRDGWTLPANAMEVINSGAQLSEPLLLFTDWMGMLNGGHHLTPVGASDSHDVSRYIVGQARTYISADDSDPGKIDVAEAVERFRAGAVMVGFGLLAEMTVDERYGPGDLVPPQDSLRVSVRVLGPAWTRAERVTLYANGQPIRTAAVGDGRRPGVKWAGGWMIPRPDHDVHLVAIAEGPGDAIPFWPIAKPYQPTSPHTNPRVLGASGAVWVDADGDGQPTDAHAYAGRLVAAAGGDLPALMRSLAGFDEAVAVQAASLLYLRGVEPAGTAVRAALAAAAPPTQRGFAAFAEALGK